MTEVILPPGYIVILFIRIGGINMRHTRLLIIPFVMLFILACGLSNGIQQIQQAATNFPTC